MDTIACRKERDLCRLDYIRKHFYGAFPPSFHNEPKRPVFPVLDQGKKLVFWVKTTPRKNRISG
ncbi:hypothetical protein [Desulfovibrio sp. Fe33]|uniref:hypothetical protein n=1 Tax=Desulfovibrio sp. Fe33 TaxID=3020842 RepID=UPI00234D5207|nr:hypothetical protein [Desulfovibrio sp. Fe33]